RELERRHRSRKDNSTLVKILLDRRRDEPCYADAVATHFHRLRFPCFIQESELHRIRILGAQLKDVSYLDAAADLENALAVRAGIARHDVADSGDILRHIEVASEIETDEMITVFICPTGNIAHYRGRAIEYDRQFLEVLGLWQERADRSKPCTEY